MAEKGCMGVVSFQVLLSQYMTAGERMCPPARVNQKINLEKTL